MHLRSSPFMIDGGPRPAGHRFVSDFDGLQPQVQRRLSSLLGSGQLRVNLVVLTVGRPLPVFPNKGTFSASVGVSQRCQAATLDSNASTERGRQLRRPLIWSLRLNEKTAPRRSLRRIGITGGSKTRPPAVFHARHAHKRESFQRPNRRLPSVTRQMLALMAWRASHSSRQVNARPLAAPLNR
jgi:hypothetical protein